MVDSTSPEGKTKHRLLEAAERLFAEQGVDRASLRAITQEAEANLAAVHYHFGSKEGLLKAVLARRIGPLNEDRLRLLEEAIEAHGGVAPVDEIVRAFASPILRMVQRERGGHAFARFVSRTFSEPDPARRQLVLEVFGEVLHRFVDELDRALPDLPKEEIFWRFLFMVGAMSQTAGFGFMMRDLSGGLCDPLDVDAVIERLAAFLEAGMAAPAAVASSREVAS